MLQEINDSNWEIINSDENDKVKVVDFYATWCGPCKVISSFLENLSEEIGEDVEFFKANVEDCIEASELFGIRNVPTLIFLKKGEVIDRMVGMGNKDKIKKFIEDSQK